MTVTPIGATDRARDALSGGTQAPLVLLGNFEVEERWAIGERGLPRISSAASTVIVNRMDEFALLLAGPGDYVVVKAPPDEEYLAYLDGLGMKQPTILAPARQDPAATVTGDACADPELVRRLAALSGKDALLWPHGVSEVEERLSRLTGLALAAPAAEVCKAVNSKVYSRLLADELGLRQPAGRVCRNLAELSAACDWAETRLAAGRRLVAKDAYGVSGKGMLILRDVAAARRLHRMLSRRAEQAGDGMALVIEEWVDKQMDLNYQFTISRTGASRVDFVKEALTHNGAHRGHWMPARLTDAQRAVLYGAATAIGERLAAAGYFGLVGVDAMTDPAGGVYPVTEINARNNMSTYQEPIRERFAGDGVALATQYTLRLRAPVPFGHLRRLLDGLVFDPVRGHGLLVNNFATVNAAVACGRGATGAEFEGRLYAMVIAADRQHAVELDTAARARLGTVLPVAS